jgi:hypothetical protein
MLQALLDRHGPHALIVWWRVALLGAALAGALVGGDAPPAERAPQGRALAIAAGRRGDFGALLEQLRVDARSGDVASQELLGMLLLGGPAALSFGGADGERTCEALAWLALAADHGSRVGADYRDMMGTAESAYARRRCVSEGD